VIITAVTSPEQLALMRSARWPVLVKPVGLPSLLEIMKRACLAT